MSKLEVELRLSGELEATINELSEKMDKLTLALESCQSGKPEPEVEEEAEEVKPSKVAGKKRKPSDPIPEEEQVDDRPLFEDTEEEDEGPTLEDVRKVVKNFATKHGKDKALKLLSKFKVTSIPDIKKADYAKVIELAKKHL